MELKDRIGQRILVKMNRRGLYNQSIQEVKILEVSPSGTWVKLMNMDGHKFWKAVTDVSLVEVLKDLNSGKPKQ
jgi:hypothetical protein